MNQENLFKKIGSILNELNDQYDYLAQHRHQLNELELALFQANANFLSDHTKILIQVSSRNQAPQLPDVTEEPPKEVEIEEEIFKIDAAPSTFEFILNEHSEHENMEAYIVDEKFEFEEKPADELFNRPLSQEEENILAQKRKLTPLPVEPPIEVDEDEIGPEPFLVSKPEEEIVETKLEPDYKPTLNDLLAPKTDANVNKPQLSDLKQGINLNDKLLYIKDLFNGYNLAYAEAIDLANKLPNFEAADNFFKRNYAVKNNWAEKQATVDKFYALLNQRFK